ncbi:uncharacterized protein [Apostichopus japonicus]|uniref:uncharacterized protein isoform X1 n=1 Tax=Stichopus japonicus TaxID=307972 RepID=UPI003AB62E2C
MMEKRLLSQPVFRWSLKRMGRKEQRRGTIRGRSQLQRLSRLPHQISLKVPWAKVQLLWRIVQNYKIQKDAFFPCPETFLQVGDVVQASGIGVSEGVQNIWKDGSSYTCEGFVIDKTDFCISGPTKKVDKASVHFSRYVKQTLKGATKKAFHASQEKSKHDYVYRKAVRTGHLRQACSGGSRKSS